MKVFGRIEELIGNTPLYRISNIEKELSLNASIYAKLEYFNPAGSVKDRAALYMINAAENAGLLKEGSVIIEPTSGNTGIGLAAIGAYRGYKTIFTMPESMSIERRKLLAAYGAEIVLTHAADGMAGAIAKANELKDEIEGSFIPGQFENPANAEAHYYTTGPEIWRDTDGKNGIFIAGVGTGGTISGIGKYLKEQNPKIKVVAVEPESSNVLSGGKAGSHPLMGIGAGFVPDVLDCSIYDEVMCISEEEAYRSGRMMARREGILVGITSGAVLAAAVKLAQKTENSGKNIVVLMPDSGDKYLSTPMFE